MDTNPSYLLRWRGRQHGPFTMAQIERKLADNEIGMLHEIQVDGEWLTLRSRLERMDAERRAEAEAARADAQGSSHRGGAVARSTQTESGSASAGASEAPDARLGVSECIKRGWQLTIKNPVETIVGVLMFNFMAGVMGVLFYGVGAWSASSNGQSFITRNPFVFVLSITSSIVIMLVYFLVLGALQGGLWQAFIRVARGERGSLGDLFAGFRRAALQLGLGLFISGSVLTIVPMLPMVIYIEILFLFGLATGVSHSLSEILGGTSLFFTGLFTVVGFVLSAVVSLALFIYCFISRFLFVAPLIVDKQVNFIRAMKLSSQRVSLQFWSVFGLVLLALIIALSGLLLCGVGTILSFPVAFMSLAVVYTVLFSAPDQLPENAGSFRVPAADSGSNTFRWLLGIGLAIIVGLATIIAVWAFAITRSEATPHGKSGASSEQPARSGGAAKPQGVYTLHVGAVTGADGTQTEVPDRYVNFSSAGKCQAKLDVLSDRAGDYGWRQIGDKIELLGDAGAVTAVFRFDKKSDTMTQMEEGKDVGVYQH